MKNRKRNLIDRGQIVYTWWELPNGKLTDGVTLQSLIHAMPTVDAVEVVHGHWIDDCTNIVCSECKAEYSDEIIFMNRDFECNELNYCPNCGAQMDEEM